MGLLWKVGMIEVGDFPTRASIQEWSRQRKRSITTRVGIGESMTSPVLFAIITRSVMAALKSHTQAGRSPLPTPVPAGRCCTSPNPPFSHLLLKEKLLRNPTPNRNHNSRPATAPHSFCNPRTKPEARQHRRWVPPGLVSRNYRVSKGLCALCSQHTEGLL